MNDNLRPPTTIEARERGKKGGKASGEARRKRKAMKDQINLLLSLPFPDVKDKNGKQLKGFFKQLGIDDENIDNQMAMLVAVYKTALSGGKNQIQAVQFLRDTAGEKPVDKVENKITKTNKLDGILEQLKE